MDKKFPLIFLSIQYTHYLGNCRPLRQSIARCALVESVLSSVSFYLDQTIMSGLNSLPYLNISYKTKWMNRRTVLSFCCWWWWFMRNLSFTLGFWHTCLGNSRLLMNAGWLDRWYLEQSDLAEGFPACGRGVGTRLSLRSLPTQNNLFLWHALWERSALQYHPEIWNFPSYLVMFEG